jgi:hypothetical protein
MLKLLLVLTLQTLAQTSPQAKLGQECNDENPCVNGLTCPEIPSTEYSCRLTAYYGEECESQVERIFSKVCNKGLKCDHSIKSEQDTLDGQGGICIKNLTRFKEIGQECGTFISCEKGLTCYSVSDTLRICRSTAYLGEECEKPGKAIYAKVCDSGLICDNSTKSADVYVDRGRSCLKAV